MPDPAAELDLICFQLSEEAESRANEVVLETGFLSFESEVRDNRRVYNYQPFEIHERNKSLIDDCVERLQEEFPKKDVWLEDWRNRESKNPVSHSYAINIAPDRETAGTGFADGARL